MLLGTSGAIFLVNMLAGKGIVRAGSGRKRKRNCNLIGSGNEMNF